MHIEVWKGAGKKQPWRWHAMNRGKITASAEGFTDRSHALARAKGFVRAVVKPTGCVLAALNVTERNGKTILRWA